MPVVRSGDAGAGRLVLPSGAVRSGSRTRRGGNEHRLMHSLKALQEGGVASLKLTGLGLDPETGHLKTYSPWYVAEATARPHRLAGGWGS